MSPAETPLSDLITRCVDAWSERSYEQFISTFLRAQVGVIVRATGDEARAALAGEPGTTIVTGEDQFTFGQARLADGRDVLLACADFEVFRRRFSGAFNATVPGRDLVKAVMANDRCQGIQINSAASPHSLVIDRATLQRIAADEAKQPSGRKPWWRPW